MGQTLANCGVIILIANDIFASDRNAMYVGAAALLAGLPLYTLAWCTKYIVTIINEPIEGDEGSVSWIYKLAKGGSLYDLYAIQFLLHLGADPNQTTRNQPLPSLYAAIEGGNKKIIQEIINWRGSPTLTLSLNVLKERAQSKSHLGYAKYPVDCIDFAISRWRNRALVYFSPS